MIEGQRHLSVLDVLSFMAAYCDTGHHLVVAKVRKRLAVNIQRPHRFHVEELYRVEVSDRFATAEHVDLEVDINSAQETIRI
jgi:hypothetical protein